jgi:hypothetical protein
MKLLSNSRKVNRKTKNIVTYVIHCCWDSEKKKLWWTGQTAWNAQQRPEEINNLDDEGVHAEDNIKQVLDVDWIPRNRNKWRDLVNTVMNLRFPYLLHAVSCTKTAHTN